MAKLGIPYMGSKRKLATDIIKSIYNRHRSSLSATNTKKQVFENIYWNGKGNLIKNQLSLF